MRINIARRQAECLEDMTFGFAGTTLSGSLNGLRDVIPGTAFDLTLPLERFRAFLDAPCGCKPTALRKVGAIPPPATLRR